LVDCVFLDVEDIGDLSSGQAIPGGEAEKLAVGGRELIQRCKDPVFRWLAGVRVGSTGVGGDLGGEVGATPTRPVLIGYDPVRHPEQPRPVGIAGRDVPEPPPGHCKHVGRAVFGIARTYPPQAVAEDGLVMRLEEPVETLLSFARRTDDTARGHSRLSLGTLGVRVALIAYTPSVCRG
jgi:hypothetical protein